MPFAQPPLVGTEDQRNVREHRQRRAECVEEEHVFGRIRDVVIAADDVRDPHIDVVDGRRQVIDRMAVGSHDDEVFDMVTIEFDASMITRFRTGSCATASKNEDEAAKAPYWPPRPSTGR